MSESSFDSGLPDSDRVGGVVGVGRVVGVGGGVGVAVGMSVGVGGGVGVGVAVGVGVDSWTGGAVLAVAVGTAGREVASGVGLGWEHPGNAKSATAVKAAVRPNKFKAYSCFELQCAEICSA